MSFGYPVMALSNPVPNSTFSIPRVSAPNHAAGWTMSTTNMTAAEEYVTDGRLAHDRGQIYTLGGSGSVSGNVKSSPARPGQMTARLSSGSSYFTIFALVKTSGIAGGGSGTITFQIKFYSSADVELGTTTLKTLNSSGDNAASWTVIQNTVLINPPSGTHHYRLYIAFARSSGTTAVVLNIRFLNVGTWSASAGYFDWNTSLTSPIQPDFGVVSYKTSSLVFDKDTIGGITVVDRDRFVQPNVLDMPVSAAAEEFKNQIEYAFRMNRGRNAVESTTVNPGGGYWDIIVVPNQPTCLYIICGRIDGERCPLDIDRTLEWMPEPTIWQGTLRIMEHV